MATWNDYSFKQYTVNGRTRTVGSLTAPTQTTYAGLAVELYGDVATATVTQIVNTGSAPLSEVATWTNAAFWCNQDCRVLLYDSGSSTGSCQVIPANTWSPLSKYQIPTYNADPEVWIAGALVAVDVIYIYQDSGSTANWQLILTD